MGNVEAEKEPEAEEQAGTWDASGWENDGTWDESWNEASGSNLEGNYLSLGAFRMGSSSKLDRLRAHAMRAQSRELVETIRNLPRDTAAALGDSGYGSSGDRSVDVML